LGMDEIEKNLGTGTLSQVLVLTDGETSGEQRCRQLAEQAGKSRIKFSIMGVGTEWNASLIKDLAKLAEGSWHYIDVNSSTEAERVFVEEFESLAAAAFLNVEMHIRAMKDIKIKRVRMVVPEIKELPLAEPLERDKPTRYILDLSLPKRPDGKFKLADIEITFDPGTGKRETTGPVALEM